MKSRSISTEAVTLTIVAALLRLIPHPPNFAPIGGVSLLSGAKIPGWQAYLVPIVAMLATDPILSYLAGYPAYSSGTIIVYFSFLLTVLLGRVFLKKQAGLARIGLVATVSALMFFSLTNLAVWWGAPALYPHTAAGLTSCYIAALPFLGRTVLGDLFYAGVLFAVADQLTKRRTQLASVSR